MAAAVSIGFRVERSLPRVSPRVGSRDASCARLRYCARPLPRSRGAYSERGPNAVRISASAGASGSAPFRMIVLRHSDSCTQDADLRDHDRPLTSWGRTAASKLCSELVSKGWAEPDLVLCSASTRSRETLGEMMRTHTPLSMAETHFMGSLYAFAAMDGLTADHLRETVSSLVEKDGGSDDRVRTVMVIGHNKGWEEAATDFAGESVRLGVANAALLEFAGEGAGTWAEAFDQNAWKLAHVAQHGLAEPEKECETEFGGDGDGPMPMPA